MMKRITIFGLDGIVITHLQELVTDMGYQVVGVATSGEEALAMARKLHPDLVFCDERLSGQIDGISAARAIIAELDIQVLFISSSDRLRPFFAQKASAGLRSVLKPFLNQEIKNLLAEVLPLR